MKKYLLMVIAMTILTGCDVAQPGRGDKIGQIAKVQQQGLVCTTTSILVTGKYGGGETWMTVPSALVPDVMQANEAQVFVKVYFHTDFVNSLCSNDTDNRWLDRIELHPEGAPGK